MATASKSPFDLPKLRVSLGFEVTCGPVEPGTSRGPLTPSQNDARFLENDDNVAGTFTPASSSHMAVAE